MLVNSDGLVFDDWFLTAVSALTFMSTFADLNSLNIKIFDPCESSLLDTLKILRRLLLYFLNFLCFSMTTVLICVCTEM